MPSYYNIVDGNLHKGDIAKSSDINHMQRHIQDALRAFKLDCYDGEAYILGSGEKSKNDFILKAAPKMGGRYIDSYNIVENDGEFINFNYNDIRQPLVKTKTSLYSILVKLKNDSNRNIDVTFELQDDIGNPIKTNILTIPAGATGSEESEIIFDLDYYPTTPNLSYEDLIARDGVDVPPKNKENESFDEGYEFDHENEEEHQRYMSARVSKLYFVIKAPNLDAIKLSKNDDTDEVIFDGQTSLGVYAKKGSSFSDKEYYIEKGNKEAGYTLDSYNLHYKDVYTNGITYLCEGGTAIVDGEKVDCIDTHISIEGGNDYGNTLTQVYLTSEGHLRGATKQTSSSTKIDDFTDDLDDAMPMSFLPVALILNYSNALYGTSKEPLVIQSEEYNQRPRSHHERLRRVEKKIDWSNDISLPARIQYNLTEGEWVDKDGSVLTNFPFGEGTDLEKVDGISLTVDANGNLITQLSNAVTETIPVTLKEPSTKKSLYSNASEFSNVTKMVHDSKKGTIELATIKKELPTIATNASEAKLTKFNPWDDSAANRPSGTNYKKYEREYAVVKGKNGKYDNVSEYPGMTFYTKTNYKLSKLTIPIHKFQNCSGIKFFIYRRQDTNKKKNTVWLQKLIYTTKEFSLKKAKVKGKYQYMDSGFTISFGKGGLSLPKGQYVIIALPIPKSGKGSCFVETYKPANSKDFCIRYHGSANASHFTLKTRYQEIWYNSASAEGVEEKYETKGSVTSKVITWTQEEDNKLEKISSIKPIVHIKNGNKKCGYKLFANTGGAWQELTIGKANSMEGGATTFKWKMEFTGDGNGTPTLYYDKTDDYAIEFILTRKKSGTTLSGQHSDNTMCLTSKALDSDKILKEYIGDMNFNYDGTDSRFNEFEFARVWANPDINEKLLIDIQGSDRQGKYKIRTKNSNNQDIIVEKDAVDLWSYHYCDLTLDDFSKTNVNYSDYLEDIEYDENNLRFKFDSDYAYSDDDIQILKETDFTKVKNEIDDDVSTTDMTFTGSSSEDNQLFLKKVFANPIDLTKYTGLKFNFSVDGIDSTDVSLEGLGIYISSQEESEVPSDVKYRPENLQAALSDENALEKIIDPDISSASFYDGQLIALEHKIDETKDGDNICKTGFYKYVQVYDKEKNKYVYKLQQVHDVRTYNIYKLQDIIYKEDANKDFDVRIEIDQDSNNLKFVKEIGIISLNDEQKYKVKENSINTKLSASCTEAGKIIIKLVNKDDTPISNAIIIREGLGQQTTNAEGNAIFDNISGSGSSKFIFSGDNIYSASTIRVNYDFSKKIEIASTPTGNKNKLTAASNTADKITLTLLNEGDDPIANGSISYTLNGTAKTVQTNDSGKADVSVTGSGDITFEYKPGSDTNNHAKVKVQYDFNKKTDVEEIETKTFYGNEITLTLNEVRAINENCFAIYNPEQTTKAFFISPDESYCKIFEYNNIKLDSSTFDVDYTANSVAYGNITQIKHTTPYTTQINIKKNINNNNRILCYYNNPFTGGLSKYKHLGIQIASDVYIPKDSIMINLCAKPNGQDVFKTINLPTLNTVYSPYNSEQIINLSQVFGKINMDEEEIKSISISTTNRFYESINKTVVDNKNYINLFIGKIVLYRARTIPMFHKKMRFKFYSTTNGKIDHSENEITNETIHIRKIGAVLDYN